jgi:hypothetical protein
VVGFRRWLTVPQRGRSLSIPRVGIHGAKTSQGSGCWSRTQTSNFLNTSTFSTLLIWVFSKDGSKTARLTKTSHRLAHMPAMTQRNLFSVILRVANSLRSDASTNWQVFVATRKEVAMRIAIKRQLVMRLAVAVGFAALQATLATTALATPSHVRHHSAPAASSAYSANGGSWANPTTGYAAEPGTVLTPRYYYPNPFAGECTEDEGYGRFKPCDSGP